MNTSTSLIFLITFCLFSFSAFAAIASEFSVQGVLTTSDGNFITADTNILTRVYDAVSGGSVLFVDNNVVSFSNGYFTTVVGDANVLDLNFIQNHWLSLQVPGDTEMSPRLKITPAPQSLASDRAFDFNVTNSLLVGGVTSTGLGVGDVNIAGHYFTGVDKNVVFNIAGSSLSLGTGTDGSDYILELWAGAADTLSILSIPVGGVVLGDNTPETAQGTFSIGDINMGNHVANARPGAIYGGRLGMVAIGSGADPEDLNVTGKLLLGSALNNNLNDGDVNVITMYATGGLFGVLFVDTSVNGNAGTGDLNLSGAIFGGNGGVVNIGSAAEPADLNVSRDLNATNITATGSLAVGNAIGLLTGLGVGDLNIAGNIYLSGGTIFDATTTNVINVGSIADQTDLNVTRDLNVFGGVDINGSVGIHKILSISDGGGIMTNGGKAIFLGAPPAHWPTVVQDVNISGDLNLTNHLFSGSGRIYRAVPENDSVIYIGDDGSGTGDLGPTDLNVSRDLNATHITATGSLAVGSAIHLLAGLSPGDLNVETAAYVGTDLNLLDSGADNRPIWIDGNIMIRANDGATWLTCNASDSDFNKTMQCTTA